jgi:OPA family sugar phosphate sensor protein UhpC-like MFS transporter
MSTAQKWTADSSASVAANFSVSSPWVIWGTLYAAYGVSMVLRLMPAFAANAMRSDPSLNVDVQAIGTMLASGTMGALCGKFLWGWAADRWGARTIFPLALVLESMGVAVFSQVSSMPLMQAAFFVTLMAQAAGWPCMTRVVQACAQPRQQGRVWGLLSTSSRVGTLVASLGPAALAGVLPWRQVLLCASGIGLLAAVVTSLLLPPQISERRQDRSDDSGDGDSLLPTFGRFFLSCRFLLMAVALMGMAVLWDFLLLSPMMLKDGLKLSDADSLRVTSAVPFGSLLSLLTGGFLFDRLARRDRAYVMAGLLTIATLCLTVFSVLPSFRLSPSLQLTASTGLLFVFGMCLSPCYYIPVSVFSTEFGGNHCGVLVALLDAIGFAAVAVFCHWSGQIVEIAGWPGLLQLLTGIGLSSAVVLLIFLLRESKITR